MNIDNPSVWAVNAIHIVEDNVRENVIVLVFCEDEDVCKAHIQKYMMVNQIRLAIDSRPLLIEKYLKHYVEPEGLLIESEKLSESNPIILFYPHENLITGKELEAYLIKTIYPVRADNDSDKPIMLSGVPDNVAKRLWKKESHCYVIIHSVKSFW
ncbi:hypothetical protein QJU23_09435, partial [Pasteurella atlantica]